MTSLLNVKKDFPIFKQHPKLVYLDNAATSQKPNQVISAVTDFYTSHNSNIHRGIYSLSQEATEIFENSRSKVAKFIGANGPEEIIFTGNASEAINLAVYGYARKYLKPGDVIVLSEMEHHSNFVPWLRLKEEKRIKLFFIPINYGFGLGYRTILTAGIAKEKIRLVALTHASNVLGTINPIAEITAWLRKNGITAKILVDAAQSVPHIPVKVKDLQCDFLAFSSHKMLGPSGVGVLWGKKELLESMDPLFVGSHMISLVTKEKAEWADVPEKFETGTGKLEGVVGLGAAIDYLTKIGMPQIARHEKALTEYGLKIFAGMKNVELYGSRKPTNRLGVFSFNVANIHPHDVGEILNRTHICVRTGHHCAQPLMQALGVSATVRASVYLYNTKEDLDKLAEGIEEVKRIFKK